MARGKNRHGDGRRCPPSSQLEHGSENHRRLGHEAFELIEAHYLFDIPADRITAVVHPQSIVHSMVEFNDGAIKAQLGVPDMRLPIAYALGRCSRLQGCSEPLTLERLSELTFEKPDELKFPCLGFARLSLERRGTTACTVNGANEVAVAAFLKGRIPFGKIYPAIAHAVEHATFVGRPGFDDYVASNAESRRLAEEFISKA
jgi:1-deoxy-D-xylulose-5-phosphate reductoisomerase